MDAVERILFPEAYRKESKEKYIESILQEIRGWKGIGSMVEDFGYELKLDPKDLKPYKNEAIKAIGEYVRRKSEEFKPHDTIIDVILGNLVLVVAMFGIEPEELEPYKNYASTLAGYLFYVVPLDRRDEIVGSLKTFIKMFNMKSEGDLQPLKDQALEQIEELNKSKGGISDYEVTYIIDLDGILGIKPKPLGPYKYAAVDNLGRNRIFDALSPGGFYTFKKYFDTFDLKPEDFKQSEYFKLYESNVREMASQLLDKKEIRKALTLARMFGVIEIDEKDIEKIGGFLESLHPQKPLKRE